MQIFSTIQPDAEDLKQSEILALFSSRVLPSSEAEWKDRYVAVLTPEEAEQNRERLGFPEFAVRECTNDVIKHPKIDVFEGLTYGILNHISDTDNVFATQEIAFFLTPRGLVLVSEHSDLLDKAIKSLELEKQDTHTSVILPEKTLFFLMERIIISDMALIRNLDETETLLEEKLLAGEKLDYPAQVFRLRQKTLVLTQYAGLMVDLMDILEENDNCLLRPEAQKTFHLISVRFDRMERAAATLRESVMQLREAYQSQVDIDANLMMRLFTVVSTIFLPLTLVTGWFGMNFRNMPELSWEYGYPMVAVISVIVTIGIIWFCKKRKYL